MLILPEERIPMARLVTFLELGERLAHDCATAQAALVQDPKSRRFLNSQVRQEAMHARVFQGVVGWMAPRHCGGLPFLQTLKRFRELIDKALTRGDFLESILAEQIILEGLGEAILNRIEAGLAKRQAPFQKLRRVFLQQEEAHHGFGLRMLERALSSGQVTVPELQTWSQPYVALTDDMIFTLADLFDEIQEDATAYVADAKSTLPSWLRTEPNAS